MRLEIDLIAAGYFPSRDIVKSYPRHFDSRISGRESGRLMEIWKLSEAQIEAIAMLERASFTLDETEIQSAQLKDQK